MRTVFLALLLISSVAVIISTTLMEPKQEGMGSITGTSANTFQKSARGKEKLLQTVTIVSAIVFAVSTVIVTVLSK